MKEIKAPGRILETNAFYTLFIAGGITGCPDWQAEFVDRLKDTNLYIYNPRRDDFDVSDPNASRQQIEWEFKCLHHPHLDLISFWFPKETLCPITLFELGAALNSFKNPIVIGVETGYQRQLDVIEQTRLIRPKLPIHGTLDEMAIYIEGYLAK